MKSLSEIETTSKRASRAAGFSWGIAEDVGKCIRLLELFGLPGIKNLNQYFQIKKNKNFEIIKLIDKENKSNELSFCPISVGVAFLDQIKRLENYKRCSFEEVEYPLLLLPFLSRSSEMIGKKILVKIDEFQFLLNFNLNIFCSFLDKELPLKAQNIEVIFLENKDNFNDLDWNNLYKLSEDTFVEENDSLKQGAAGAGLTDND